MNKRSTTRRVSVIGVLVVLLLLAVAPASADAGGVPVPPNARPFGQTYGEWGGQWWIWALGIPADQSPLLDATGANCAVNQSGPVWYLAGTMSSEVIEGNVVGQAERTCSVPLGKALFFPVLNAECSTVEGNGTTYDELLGCASGLMDSASVVQAEWDGVPIGGDPLSPAFRVQSPLMTFELPENNVMTWCGPTYDQLCPAGPSSFATDGYYVMLTPPSQGQHTLHLYGEVPLSDTSSFLLDVTYHLNIGD